jgi:transcriptional regulator with XRE-family HTH domain
MTLRELAGLVEVSMSYISDMEHGRRGIPNPELLEKLEACLNIVDGRLKTVAQDQQEVRQNYRRKLETLPSTEAVALMRVISTMTEEDVRKFVADNQAKEK